MKSFTRFCFSVFCIILFSCSSSNTGDVQGDGETASQFNRFEMPFQSGSSVSTLTPEQYVSWVYAQNGITYSIAENDQFDLKLIFHPPLLQAYVACINNDENPKSAFKKYLDIQKGYYYCDVECLIKYESASDPIKKIDLLNVLNEQLTVVRNNSDTISNVIVEPFPSYVMNQPNRLLIMIPNADSSNNYQITINGSPLHLKDVQLNLSSETIKSFPLIKL